MRIFNISDIENLTGIKAHNIRIWEQRYQILPTKRTQTNIRYYDDNDLCYFLNIACLVSNGFKISKVAKMSREQIESTVTELTITDKDSDARIQQLTKATIRLDHEELDLILQHIINQYGLQKAATQFFFPFLNKIGCMWQVGSINPAHEHLVTNLVRQKIIAGINQQETTHNKNAPKYLLFLPENETHDMGLLLGYYLLKKKGKRVLYLGQNMPLDDLMGTATYYKPDFIVTAVTLAQNADAEKTLNELINSLPGLPLIISGLFILNKANHLNDQVILIKDFEEFETLIDQHC